MVAHPPPSPPQAVAGPPRMQHPHLADQQGHGWSWTPRGPVLCPTAGRRLPGQGPWDGAPLLRHLGLCSRVLFGEHQGIDPSGRPEPMGTGKAQPRSQVGEDRGPVPSTESLPLPLCLEPASCPLWPVTWQEAAGAWALGVLLRGSCSCGHSTWDLLWGPVGRVGPGLSPPGGLGSTELPLASQGPRGPPTPGRAGLPPAPSAPPPFALVCVLVGLGGDQGQTLTSFGQADLCVSVRG